VIEKVAIVWRRTGVAKRAGVARLGWRHSCRCNLVVYTLHLFTDALPIEFVIPNVR